MAKIQIKSEKVTPFGGIFSIMEQFNSTLSSVIDSTLGLRCRSFGYQYSEIVRSPMSKLNSILVEKWKGKAYRLVIQRQKRMDGVQDLWEGEYIYRCILTNDYESSAREIVEFYNLRGGKERIFDDMNNGKFYKAIIHRLDVKRFGLNATSRIKAFVFRFVSVPAKWIRTSRRYVLDTYTCNNAYADIFQTDFG